jgi:hypothetical protein
LVSPHLSSQTILRNFTSLHLPQDNVYPKNPILILLGGRATARKVHFLAKKVFIVQGNLDSPEKMSSSMGKVAIQRGKCTLLMNVGLPPSMFNFLGRKFMSLGKSQLPSEARAFLLYSYLLQCSSCLRLNSCTLFHTLVAHGKSHADELQHSDLFPNLGITPTSKRVRLNLLGTSQVVQGLDT